MYQARLSVFLLAGALVACSASATTITQDFSQDPRQSGWQTFGNSNLFQWNSAQHELAVTWDSRQPNSYFFLPLGTILTRQDDFAFDFDLRLSDAASDVEVGKSSSLQVALGFLNHTVATNSAFVRGMGMVSDIAEFDFYPLGYWEWPVGDRHISPASVVPSFVSSQPSFAPSYLDPYYVLDLPTNHLVHVSMSFNAASQTASISVTSNGVALGALPGLVLNSPTNSNFALGDDFRLDSFSISSYSAIDDPYNSLLAHGSVANLHLQLPPPPVQALRCAFANGQAQLRFSSRTQWLYSLERSSDFCGWSAVGLPVEGTGATVTLQDPSAPAQRAFYRVRAQRP